MTITPMTALLLLAPQICLAGLTAASLNPVVTDLARQIGGTHVTITELMKPGENPHVYEPTPEQLRSAAQADIVLAAGKGLESYLPDLRDTLGGQVLILEVGRNIPSLRLSTSDILICCPGHTGNSIDPHWWHSILNLQRAARIIANAFAELDPDHKTYYQEQSTLYSARLDQLNSWIKKEIYRIPRQDRILTTAHTSFGYFCRDFGFKAIPAQGLSSEATPDPQHLTSVVKAIRNSRIKAVFPEKNVNPGVLNTIIRESGVEAGGYLLADGPELENPTCEAMFRHNVTVIVNALAPDKE